MLGVPKSTRRNRTLSVVQFSDVEKTKMNSSVQELDSLIKHVKRSWKVSPEENSNPLEIALPLLDSTSVGLAHRLPEFHKLTNQISHSLQVAVNEHYQAFNNSVGSYDSVCGSINESQETVKHVKSTLKQISSDIASKNQQLSELNERSKQYGDMDEILDAIGELKKLPAQIDNLFADKKFALVEDLLSQGESQAEKYQLWRIPALNGIKNYLSNARKNLVDTLLEELQATVYLKSKSGALLSLVMKKEGSRMGGVKTGELSNLELYISNIVSIDVVEKSSMIETKLESFLKDFERQQRISVSYHQTDFENDPYNYIKFLLQILAKLNNLPKALEFLAQRHSLELHKIVNDTTDEIKLSHPNLGRKREAVFQNTAKDDTKEDVKIVDFGMAVGDLNNVVLQDFFWQVFTKFLLVLQSHRVVFEIAKKLSDLPEDQFINNSSSYNFSEIWKNMFSEVRSLMYSYITNDIVVFGDSKHSNSSNHGKGPSTPLASLKENFDINELFKKKNNLRSNTLFSFNEDTFQEENGEVKSLNSLHSQELKSFLKEVFPGFKINDTISNALIAESGSPYLENEGLSHQETLIPGNIFNMRVILESFLVFVQGSKTVFPNLVSNASASTDEPVTFFNEFMKKTFLPQLDETLEYMYNNTVNVNSFEIESISNYKLSGGSLVSTTVPGGANTSNYNDIKVFKSSISFFNLFTKVCEILNTSVKYREEYSSLAVQLLPKFYGKYDDLYTTLLPNINQPMSNSENNFKQLNRWLKSPELSHISLEIVNSKGDDKRKLLSTETAMLLSNGVRLLKAVDKTQILHPKNLDSLTHLLGTVDWILQWLPEMRREHMIESVSQDLASVDYLRSTWELVEFNQTNPTSMRNVKVTLQSKSELLNQFDDVCKDFEKLFLNTLLAIRYDIRLRLIYYITATIQNNVWNPSTDITSICQEVKELCNLIQFYKSKLFSSLDPKIGERILYGIPNVIDKLFISGSEMIEVLNQNGIKKLYLNIITIQQSLRTVMRVPEDVDFTHSLAYFDLFKKGVDKIIEQNKNRKSLFNLQENKNMIRLIYSQDIKDHERDHGPPVQLNRAYHEHIRELERAS